MESMYLNWARGNRVKVYAGIMNLPEGVEYSSDYIAMYVPLAYGFNPSSEEVVAIGKANSRAVLVPDLSVSPAKYRIQVVPNPVLYEYADVMHEPLLEPGSDSQPKLYVRFRKDLDLSELKYLVRLYLVG